MAREQLSTASIHGFAEGPALAWLDPGGWRITRGPDITPNMLTAKSCVNGVAVPAQRLRDPQ